MSANIQISPEGADGQNLVSLSNESLKLFEKLIIKWLYCQHIQEFYIQKQQRQVSLLQMVKRSFKITRSSTQFTSCISSTVRYPFLSSKWPFKVFEKLILIIQSALCQHVQEFNIQSQQILGFLCENGQNVSIHLFLVVTLLLLDLLLCMVGG